MKNSQPVRPVKNRAGKENREMKTKVWQILAVSMAALCVSLGAARAFDGTFESLQLGSIHDQDGWILNHAQSNLTVVVNDAVDEMTGQKLRIGRWGGTNMGQWLRQNTPEFPPTGPDFRFQMCFLESPGLVIDFFLRLNGAWNVYFGLKQSAVGATPQLFLRAGGTAEFAYDFPTAWQWGETYDYRYTVSADGTLTRLWVDGIFIAELTGTNYISSFFDLRSQRHVTYIDNLVVPEPSAMMLTGSGLVAVLALYRRRRRLEP